MEGISEPTTSSDYKQVTVEVPEERLAEFHAFFARFLAGRGRRGRRGEYRRHGYGRGHANRQGRCEPGEAREGQAETPAQAPEIAEA
jgi:hypothetical protein